MRSPLLPSILFAAAVSACNSAPRSQADCDSETYFVRDVYGKSECVAAVFLQKVLYCEQDEDCQNCLAETPTCCDGIMQHVEFPAHNRFHLCAPNRCTASCPP